MSKIKIATINIPPLNRSALSLRYANLSNQDRVKIFKDMILKNNFQIVVFTEQYYPIYSVLKKELNNYQFFQTFDSKSVYSAVTVAVNKNSKITNFKNGNDIVESREDKIVSFKYNGLSIVALHAPSAPEKEPYISFMDCLNHFVPTNKPDIILGDFNDLRGTQISFKDYQDVLSPAVETTLFHTKTDHIFVKKENLNKFKITASIDNKIMDLCASDHAITILEMEF